MVDPKAADDTKAEKSLPISRIRTIMKSTADPDVLKVIKEETLQVVSKATELFIQEVAKECYKRCDAKAKSVEYKQLAEYVQSEERFEFLHQILPKKITVKEFRKIVENLPDPDDSTADSSSSSSTSSSSEEEEEVKEVKAKPAKQVRTKKIGTKASTSEIIDITDD